MKRLAVAAMIFGASTAPAFAHIDPAEDGSLAAGLSHPLSGPDHVLAMVAVGLWAVLLAARPGPHRALWLVPAAFVGTMTVGFGAALTGAPLPFVEPVILASVVVIGLLAAVALRVPTILAMAIVGFFAFFHGHAHGGELGEAGALPFMIGFALSTAFLHAAGVGLGVSLGQSGDRLARALGGLTALAGVALGLGAFG